MATDLSVRRVKTNSADVATDLASDLSTANCNAANLKTVTASTIGSDCIILTYTYG